MRIFLNGYYGFSNLGDEALLWTLLRALLAQSGPSTEFLIRSAQPLPLPPELPAACRLVGNSLAALVEAAHGADLTVFGGGSQFQDHGLISNLRYFIKPLVVTLAARRLTAIGVSIGPLGTWPGRMLAHGILSRMDSILTRDVASFRCAEELGCPVLNASDICFADYLQLPAAAKFEREPCLGVSLLPRALLLDKNQSADRSWLTVWADAMMKLAESNPQFTFLGAPFQRGVDNAVIDQAFMRIPTKRRRLATLDQGPEQALVELNACSHVVAMRFHALVFATLLGKPTLILDYHPKVRLLAEELGYSPHAILSPSQWHDPDKVGAGLAGLINEPEKYLPTVDVRGVRKHARRQLDMALSKCVGKA
ncbi:polysaccharide pyruvyl transferase family protein [Methylomicrobium sp. Wu6]|uniref:polysaccharide pyruvyl transferase family protein n=1 Tax=Methylomicrobium sp. Wu6 TaxID=3107928 RepID=UPI002DD69D50|nr:polysaccharide pyruvyl transferase family protein [Methylomicrobium sp. Wu6]MEC4747376.1 polysaccharide pyruvyl transferase family protein [Methylomicrobium sp. Wu6]